MIKRIFWTLLTLSCALNLAQASAELPESFKQALPQIPIQSHYRFETFDQRAKELVKTFELEPNRFAISSLPSNKIDYAGSWQESEGHHIWRAKFSSKQAKSINLRISFSSIENLPEIFFYSEDRTQVFGPLKPNAKGEIWTPIIERSSNSTTTSFNTILEIDLLSSSKQNFTFNVEAINLGFRRVNKNQINEGCQFDVACDEALPYQNLARSVARFSVLGQFFCSGSLLNNALNNSRAYFLTAKHCEITNSSASSMVFYWNYQASECNGERNGDLSQTTSGASLRASSEKTDFALLELDELPPAEFLPYFSGWSSENIVPPNSFSIHHPFGLEKSISFDLEPPITTQAYSETENLEGHFFRVNGWELGSTTDGSSGAGLWNFEGKLIGTLTGGFATCEQPQAPDWYSRLSSQWSQESWKHSQLAYWLSPEDATPISIDGSESCEVPDFSVQLSSNSPSLNEEVQYSVVGVDENTIVEWDFNDDGVYEDSGRESNYAFSYIYRGNIRVRVTQVNGCSKSQVAFVSVQNNGHEQFPIGGRLSALWNQTRTSDKGWRLDTSRSLEGQYSLKSDRIQNGQTAGIEFIHNYTTREYNYISFAVSTSTQSGDVLKFYIDNELIDQWQGENSWQVNYYPVQPGLRVFKWVYEKDSEGNSGNDAVWIDAVSGFDREESTSGGGADFCFLFLLLLFRRKSRDRITAIR